MTRLLRSFGFAFRGLRHAYLHEQNLRIHSAVTVIVVIAGFYAGLDVVEWSVLILTIAVVLAMELMNTAVEKLVDFVSPDHHDQAGMVKDISAGAVVITAIAAVIIGVIIFLPKIF